MITITKNTSSILYLSQAAEEAVSTFNNLSVDEQLGLLWVLYQTLGCTLTTTPGPARLFLTQGLLHRIKQMSYDEQLQVLRDLLSGVDSAIARQYGLFVPNTKLAFWYQIFEWMFTGEVASVPAAGQLSPQAAMLLTKIASLKLDDQTAVVRQLVTDFGVAPLAA